MEQFQSTNNNLPHNNMTDQNDYHRQNASFSTNPYLTPQKSDITHKNIQHIISPPQTIGKVEEPNSPPMQQSNDNFARIQNPQVSTNNRSEHNSDVNNQYAPYAHNQTGNLQEQPRRQSLSTSTMANNKSKKKNVGSNEKFIVIAILSSVIITSVIIGLGWSLFSPKSDPSTLQTENNALSTQNTSKESTLDLQINSDITSPDNALNENEDLVIVYGTNTVESTASIPISKVTDPTPVEDKRQVVNTQKPVTTLSTKNISSPKVTQVAATAPTANIDTTATQTKYWIQIFSTTNRDKATQIKQEFTTQGIAPTIVTKTINETLYYRLRIGPYYNKAESNKFLTWVRKNNDYQDAYISVANGS